MFHLVNNSTNPRRVGSIADIDPANGVYGSITEPNNQNQYYQQQNQIRQGHQHSHIHQTQQQQQQQPQQNHQSKANMVCCYNSPYLILFRSSGCPFIV